MFLQPAKTYKKSIVLASKFRAKSLDFVEFITFLGFCMHSALNVFLQPVNKCQEVHSLWPINSVRRSGLCRSHYLPWFLYAQCPHLFLPLVKSQDFNNFWPANVVRRSGLCKLHYSHWFLQAQCPHIFLQPGRIREAFHSLWPANFVRRYSIVYGQCILCEGLDSVESITSIGFCRHSALRVFISLCPNTI